MVGFIFGGDTGETPQSLARKRALVAQMMADQNYTANTTGGGVGNIFAALGRGIGARGLARQADAAEQTGMAGANADSGSLASLIFGGGTAAFPSAPVGTVPVASNSDASKIAPASLQSGDGSLAPEQKALLDTIAGPESGGRYDIMYGGGKLADLSDHPRRGVPITSGPNAGKTSSAAGKYQFLGSTWDDQAKKLGLKDFSPASQDKAAWNLAQESYKRATGNDLDAVLKSGDPEAIAGVGKALAPIWTSLPGGIEQGTNTSKFMNAFQRNLGAAPAAGAVNAMAQGRPIPRQIASNDPSAMMADLGVPFTGQPMTEAQRAARRAEMAPGIAQAGQPYAPPQMPGDFGAIQQQIASQQPPVDPRQAISDTMAGQGGNFPPEFGPQDIARLKALPRPADAVPFNGPPELSGSPIAGALAAQQAPAPGEVGGPAAVTPEGQRALAPPMQQKALSGAAPLPMQGQPPMPPQGMPQQVPLPPQGQTLPPPQGAAPQGQNPMQGQPGTPGQVKRGPDGKAYQYVETTGMAGATGPFGWIPVNEAALGAQAPQQASQPQQPPPQSPAQAGPDMSQYGPAAGGTGGTVDPKQFANDQRVQMAMKVLQNPFANDSMRAVAQTIVKQAIDAQDPGNALDTRYKEASIHNIESEIAKRSQPERASFGNQPIWGQDASGKWVVMQPSSSGGIVPAATPEGINLVPPGASNLNLGTSYAVRDRAGNIISQQPIDNAGQSRDTAIGKQQGEQLAAAPGDIVAAQNAMDLIDQIRNDPYKGRGTGGSAIFNAVPGTGGYDFANKVAGAKAGAFLTAIQQMRGLGSLSDAEGKAATSAINRLNTSTSEEEFNAALDSYQKIVQQGLERAQARLGGNFSAVPSGQTQSAPSGDGWNDMGGGVKIRVKP